MTHLTHPWTKKYGLVVAFARRADILTGEQPMMVELGGPGARDAVREYAKRVDASVQGLDHEVENEIVSDSTPEELDAQAKATEALPFSGHSTVAGALRAKAARLRALNVKRTPQQVQLARDFYKSWRTFDATWTEFYDKLFSFGPTLESPSSAWDQVESYETHLNGYRSSFATATGAAPITPPPPTAAQIAADHTAPPKPPGEVAGTLQLLIKGAVVIAIAGAVVTAVRHSRT